MRESLQPVPNNLRSLRQAMLAEVDRFVGPFLERISNEYSFETLAARDGFGAVRRDEDCNPIFKAENGDTIPEDKVSEYQLKHNIHKFIHHEVSKLPDLVNSGFGSVNQEDSITARVTNFTAKLETEIEAMKEMGTKKGVDLGPVIDALKACKKLCGDFLARQGSAAQNSPGSGFDFY